MAMARTARAMRAGPLAGRTIVVTRAAAQAQRFVQLLEEAGARVVQAPTIAIEPPPSWEPLDAALAALDTFTWVVFTSVNGVLMLGKRLTARGLAWAAVGRKRIAAIGPATAEALAEHGVRVELVPREFRAEALVEGLRGALGPGDRVLLPRARETRDVLVVELRRLGAAVSEVPAYQTKRVENGVERLRGALAWTAGGLPLPMFPPIRAANSAPYAPAERPSHGATSAPRPPVTANSDSRVLGDYSHG